MAKKYVNELYLTNYKKHKEMAVKIRGRNFIVGGKNGTGKTSLFQAILRLLGRLPESQQPEAPITNGEDSGLIKSILVADGTEYMVEERYTKRGKARIKFFRITDGKSDELKPAQERIGEIFGNVMDLSPLVDMAGEDQFKYLQKVFKIDVAEYKHEREKVKEQRKSANNRVKSLKSIIQMSGFTKEDRETYKEERQVGEVLAKRVEEEQILNRLHAAGQEELERNNRLRVIQEAEKQIADLHKKLESLKSAAGKPPVFDKKLILEELEQARETNKKIDDEVNTLVEHNLKVQKVREISEFEKDLEVRAKEADELTVKMEALDQGLQERLKQVPFPEICEGMELKYDLDEEGKIVQAGLFLRGLPFNRAQHSYGEMVQCLIRFSTSINPDGLNFIYIGDWNLLDEDNQNGILKFARENESSVQLGIEKVDNTSSVEISFIEA